VVRIDLDQDGGQWTDLLRVPQDVGKFLESCTIGGFSRRAQLLIISNVNKPPYATSHNQLVGTTYLLSTYDFVRLSGNGGNTNFTFTLTLT
jgi:hypothetical protein